MDSQLKKGVVEILILAELVHEDSYGYAIVQELNKVTTITESTLYPILRRLESSGALEVYNKEYGGRLRKYYRITPKGKIKIHEFVQNWREFEIIYEHILRKLEE